MPGIAAAARLRRWILILASALLLVVAGFYTYARLRVNQAVRKVPASLGVNVQQTTEGFTISKSEGGRTLFTIKAARAVRFRQGGRAELHDVSIVVYGRKADRFDQISGSKFSYEPSTGDVRAEGEVHIDLEGHEEGPQSPDQAPPAESKNPIHLKTSGLVFNQKTGFAATNEMIEFRFPQASGSARGVTFDSRTGVLTLQSDVNVTTTGRTPAKVSAQHGTITKEPRQAVLNAVRVEQAERTLQADVVTLDFRDDNSIGRVTATGSVRAEQRGARATQVTAPRAQFDLGARNQLESATLSGGVQFNASGNDPVQGSASRVLVDFRDRRVHKMRAEENVRVSRSGGEQPFTLSAAALDVLTRGGRISRATTSGTAQVELGATAQQGRTVVTAGRFEAEFGGGNQLRTLRGAPDATIRMATPGQPERTSTSRELVVQFAGKGNEIAAIIQQGEVEFREGTRTATAQRARYEPRAETITLSGAPRISDTGLNLAARTITLNRRTGDATAEGEVKGSYSDVKPNPAGAMLGGSEAIHVTAGRAVARQQSGSARFSGGARLWQGANIIQAPAMEFHRDRRSLSAEGAAASPVLTVFVQAGSSGRVTPVQVAAPRVTYDDAERRARYLGGVTMRGADGTISAEQVDIRLLARGAQAQPGASQVERVVADGNVLIQQGDRKAQGERLTFTPEDGKFVLVGERGIPPSIFDAELGSVTGDSLTFYSRDDRVVVSSGTATRTVTRARVKDASPQR